MPTSPTKWCGARSTNSDVDPAVARGGTVPSPARSMPGIEQTLAAVHGWRRRGGSSSVMRCVKSPARLLATRVDETRIVVGCRPVLSGDHARRPEGPSAGVASPWRWAARPSRFRSGTRLRDPWRFPGSPICTARLRRRSMRLAMRSPATRRARMSRSAARSRTTGSTCWMALSLWRRGLLGGFTSRGLVLRGAIWAGWG